MNFLILCKFRMEETQYIYAYFQSFFQVDNVDGNINGLEIVLWIRARNEGQDLDSTVDRILTGIQSRNFTKSFGDGSMVQLRTTSSCQDLKCENKTETVFAKIPPTTTITSTTTTTTPTTTTTTCSRCFTSPSRTLFYVDMVLISLTILVAYTIAKDST